MYDEYIGIKKLQGKVEEGKSYFNRKGQIISPTRIKKPLLFESYCPENGRSAEQQYTEEGKVINNFEYDHPDDLIVEVNFGEEELAELYYIENILSTTISKLINFKADDSIINPIHEELKKIDAKINKLKPPSPYSPGDVSDGERF